MDTIIIPHTGCELTKNIIPLVYIKKNIIHDKKNFKNPGNLDKKITFACFTKRSDNYKPNQCQFV